MEPHAPLFPSFVAPLSDLYGASSYRVAEAHAYQQDLDDLDREELALEQTVRALVDRKAPTPIGLSFHRTKTTSAAAPHHNNNTSSSSLSSSSRVNTSTMSNRLQRGGVAPVGTEGSRLGSGVQTTRGYHGHVAEDDEEHDMDEEEDEDDMEEDETDDLEELDEEEEDEEDDRDELFPEDDDHDGEEDDRSGGDDDSMDLSM